MTSLAILGYFFNLQGNQENRVVVYDRKVVDYINFILRAGDIADCPPEKVSIGNCCMTCINKMCSPSNIACNIYQVRFVLPFICFKFTLKLLGFIYVHSDCD